MGKVQKYKIGDFIVDPSRHQLLDEQRVIAVEPQVMRLLLYLAEHQGQVVEQETLMREVWKNKVVTDNSLHRAIRQLRLALKDDRHQPKYIKTVPKKGYVLTASVKPIDSDLCVYTRPSLISFCALIVFAVIGGIYFNMNTLDKASYRFESKLLISSLPGVERLPNVSHDSKRLLFVSLDSKKQESRIVLKQIDTHEYEIIKTLKGRVTNLAWSADQKTMAYVLQSQGDCAIVIASLSKDRADKKITDCIPHTFVEIAWSYDNKYLYFGKSPGPDEQSNVLFKYDIFDNAIQQRHAFVDLRLLKRDPASHRFAFVKDMDKGSEIFLWQEGHKATKWYSSEDFIHEIAWFDKTHLLIQTDSGMFLIDEEGRQFSVKNPNGEVVQEFVVDGQQNIFSSNVEKVRTVHQYTIKNKQKVDLPWVASSRSESSAAYSRDGKRVAFITQRRRLNKEVWVKSKAGIFPIDQGGYQIQSVTLQWSPNDNFVMALTDDYRLLALSPSGAAPRFLTERNETVLAGSWGESENILFYSKPINGRFELFEKDLATGHSIQLTQNGGYYAQLSEDKQKLYFNKRNEPGLWYLVRASGEIKRVSEIFGKENYSRWQLVGNNIYFRDHENRGVGLFRLMQSGKAETLFDQSLWHFHVDPSQSRVLISSIKQQDSDLSLSRIVEE